MDLNPVQKRAKRALERLVADSGGTRGTDQIKLGEVGLLQALLSERFIERGDLHDDGRIVRTDGWLALDDLVPLDDPNRWDELCNEIYSALEDQGWIRTQAPTGTEFIIPHELVASPFITLTILTWNPDLFGGDDWWADRVQGFLANGPITDSWSTGRHVDGLQPGDMAILLRQNRERGIVAIGTVVGDIHQDESWDESSGTANYVEVQWQHLAEIDQRIPVETLLDRIPDAKWNHLYESGRQFTGDIADDILIICDEAFALEYPDEPE